MPGVVELRVLIEGIAQRRKDSMDPIPEDLLDLLDGIRDELQNKFDHSQQPALFEPMREIFVEALQLLDSSIEQLELANTQQELDAAVACGLDGLDRFEALEEAIDWSQAELSQTSEY